MANEPPATAPNQQEGQSIFGTVKKVFFLYLLITTVTGFFSKKDNNQSSTNVATTDGFSGYDLKPNLTSSSFIEISKPEIEFKYINFTKVEKVTNEEGEKVEETIITTERVPTLEAVIYNNSLAPPKFYAPAWDADSALDLEFYVNDEAYYFKDKVDTELLLKIDNVTIDSTNSQVQHFKLEVPESVRSNNGSLYLHIFSTSPLSNDVGYKSVRLNAYLPKKKQSKLRKLIADEKESETEKEEEEEAPIIAYWHPNTTISIVKPPGIINVDQLVPQLADVFPLDPLDRRDNLTGTVTQYYPLVYHNTFWQLKTHMIEINSTVDVLEFNLNIDFSKFWKVQAFSIFNDGFQQQSEFSGGLADGSELDAIKKILIETNPYLLAITLCVSLLHSLLEFLAFKNDISHWKNKKDNVGVSVRSIVANVVQQLITLLYLIDNSEGTSFMILASQGIGILIEAWKITTVLKFEIDYSQGAIPRVKISDKHKLSATEVKTKEYDSIAFKYLYWISAPLLLSYAVYSLLYKEYKSWYSFIITTLVGFVYTYGFLALVPSVYINYRLKSVAHIPKKAMAYKFVNTFIDDLFAFVIKMPWLHRLATLRDDVIFLIYLYQTWIYRTDYSRVNEFGQVSEQDDQAGETKEAEDKKEK